MLTCAEVLESKSTPKNSFTVTFRSGVLNKEEQHFLILTE